MDSISLKVILTAFIVVINNDMINSEYITKNLCQKVNSKQKDTSNFCACTNSSTHSFGLRIISIDCKYKNFQLNTFNAEILPAFTNDLDISWNEFDYIPNFIGANLVKFLISHNKIKTIDENNFDKLPNLEELDLSWNQINTISIGAFKGLELLNSLDLSHNKLKTIIIPVFSFLKNLKILNFSWNSYINETLNQNENDIYIKFGVTTQLKMLKLDHCNLQSLDISNGIGLDVLHIKGNNFSEIPYLPRGLKYLDAGTNPIKILEPKFLPHLLQLQYLLMEDMPILSEIKDYALFSLPSLKEISFQNSKKLQTIGELSFGLDQINTKILPKLQVINLRGTRVKKLSPNLKTILKNDSRLYLSGTKLICDCELRWLKDLNIETGGQCDYPPRYRGIPITQILHDQFLCNEWPSWLVQFCDGLILFLIILLCTVGIWLIVLGLRPSRRKITQKLASNSPYARVTVEPIENSNWRD